MAPFDGRPRLLDRHALEQRRETHCDEPSGVHGPNDPKRNVKPVACFSENSVVKEERRKFRQSYARVVEEEAHENYLWALKEILRAEG